MRIFGVDDVARLGLIVTCRRFRFPVEAIAELLADRDTLGPVAFQPRFAEALAHRRAALTAEIAELEQACHELDGFLNDMPQQG